MSGSASDSVVATLMRKLNMATTNDLHSAGDTDDIVDGLLDSLPIVGRQPLPKWDEEVIAPMGGNVADVARAALKNLNFHVSHPKRNIHRLARIAKGIMLITHLSNNKPVRDAFIVQHSIRALVDAMGSLSPLPTNNQSRQYATLCISNGCNCVRGHMFANYGLTGITEAFDSGILPVLLRCADLLIGDDAQYFNLLCEDLPKYIIYPSVLRTAEKSLTGFVVESASQAQSATSKRAREAFFRFQISMDEIIAIKDIGVGHGKEVCANKMCYKSDLRSALRLCGGCKDTYYCSSSCQRADWKGSHRAYCKEAMAVRNEGQVSPISPKDISFLHTLAQNELSLRERRVRSARREHQITMPVVEFDYTKYPFEITIGSAVSLPLPLSSASSESLRNDWQNTVKIAPGREANVVIRVRYPTGAFAQIMESKLFMKLDDDSDAPTPISDDLLDRFYTVKVKV
jgi:hypothetical protein